MTSRFRTVETSRVGSDARRRGSISAETVLLDHLMTGVHDVR